MAGGCVVFTIENQGISIWKRIAKCAILFTTIPCRRYRLLSSYYIRGVISVYKHRHRIRTQHLITLLLVILFIIIFIYLMTMGYSNMTTSINEAQLYSGDCKFRSILLSI